MLIRLWISKLNTKSDGYFKYEDRSDIGFLKHDSFGEILTKMWFLFKPEKMTLGPRQLGSVCSDLLHKNNFAPFSLFWHTYKMLFYKNAKRFLAYFPRKPGSLLPRRLRIRSDWFFILHFTLKRNAFMKNGINNFWS